MRVKPQLHQVNDMKDKNKLSAKDAAEYLGYEENTLRNSRISGQLAGTSAPAYIKRGNRVYYNKETLDNWLNQFQEISNTAQCSVAA